MVRIQQFTWGDFDKAVISITNNPAIDWTQIDSIYGQPRGGLALAVAISHRIGKPLSLDLIDNAKKLWIDDIYDSGKTYTEAKALGFKQLAVWVSKRNDAFITCDQRLLNNDWIVFPWESSANAYEDYENYVASR